MIRWFANNGIAANFLMVGLLLSGFYVAVAHIPLEVTPTPEEEWVRVQMRYAGGAAKDVEHAILIPIEESLEGVKGIQEMHSEAKSGEGYVNLKAAPGTDLGALQDDVEGRVNAITSFPSETERPHISIPDSGAQQSVLNIAVTGNLSGHDLHRVARRIQEDLLELPGISLAQIEGDRALEIAIEANVEKLLSYGLGFQDLADAIRNFSIDLPAGAINSESGRFVVRTRGQAFTAEDFASVPVVSIGGAEVLLGEVADIHDGFEEGNKAVEFNGKRCLFVRVLRTGNESAIDISNQVHRYVDSAATRFPEGIDLFVWDDDSRSIRGRLSTLFWSMAQGSLLVMIVLGLFLRPALAFWIVVGVPVAFAGGMLAMPSFGITFNVMSVFGFIIVVGIVVDDAIVTGENIYTKMRAGLPPLQAAVEGTHEVATPVTFGALTTMVAFIPLFFFDGKWGDYAKQIPPVVAPVLLFSLVESKLILPSHLKHLRLKESTNAFARFQASIARGLERFVEVVYQPTLNWAVSHRVTVLAIFAGMGIVMTGYCVGGHMGFVSFPSVDSRRISVRLEMPSRTPMETTERYMDRVMDALEQVKREFVDPGSGKSLILNVARVKGGGGTRFANRGRGNPTRGFITVEIMSPDDRSEPGPRNSEIANRWTELVGPIPAAREFRVYAESTLEKEYDNEYLEIELRGPASPGKVETAERVKEMLQDHQGIRNAWAHVNYGQNELELSLKPHAAELGLTQALLARQVRQAFYGEEAQRVQRGIDDIRVMVRLPQANRESLHTLDQIKIRTPRGADVPLATVANVNFTKAPSEVKRHDGAEITRIGAQPVDETVDVIGIAREIEPKLTEMCNEHDLSFQFLGYVAEAEEARRRTILGSAALLLALYAMLSIALKSLTQPFFIMLAVPFAIIGALLGHIIMGLTPSYLSIFGMLALAGIAVNDTLVMMDYVNRQRRDGVPLFDAALEAGGRRFRPIMLTSVTTFVGLMPLMMARSLHAQFLIPMAVSLAFGVMFATTVTLFLVPCSLLMGQDLGQALARLRSWYFRPFRTTEKDQLEQPSRVAD